MPSCEDWGNDIIVRTSEKRDDPLTFKALATKPAEKIETHLVELNESDLMSGDVTVSVDYSTVTYKDALALSGYADVIKTFLLTPGIDLAGIVDASTYVTIEAGDRVLANGWGLSQTHHGGFAQEARVNGDWLVKIRKRRLDPIFNS